MFIFSFLVWLVSASAVSAQDIPYELTVRAARDRLRDSNLDSVDRARFHKNLGTTKTLRILRLAENGKNSPPASVDLATILGHEKSRNGQRAASPYVHSLLQANLSNQTKVEHWTTVKLLDFSLDDTGAVATIEYSTTERIEVRSPGIDPGYGTVTVPGPSQVHQKTVGADQLRLILFSPKYPTLADWQAYLVAMQDG